MDNPFDEQKGQADDTVGYGHPPKRHRFKLGQSGNPQGRPKGSKNSAFGERGQKRINKLILDIAYKEISLKENGQRVTMPTVQAILLAINSNALKGKTASQKLIMDLIQSAEFVTNKDKQAYLETMISYKMDWEKKFRRCDKEGQPRPDIIPHPDDVILDFVNGGARIDGPLTREVRNEVLKIQKKIKELEDDIKNSLQLAEHSPELAETIEEAVAGQREIIEALEKKLPSWSDKLASRVR